jgi:hypothetical protein
MRTKLINPQIVYSTQKTGSVCARVTFPVHLAYNLLETPKTVVMRTSVHNYHTGNSALRNLKILKAGAALIFTGLFIAGLFS